MDKQVSAVFTPSRHRRSKQAVLVGTTFFGLLALTSPVLAESPSAPGVPSGSASNGQVSLQWAASTDNNEVAGYNLYINDRYARTVFGTQYSGELDTQIDNEFYVTAFDVPLSGESRRYSSRSDVLLLAASSRVEPSAPDTDDTNDSASGGIDTQRPAIPSGLALISAERDALSFSWGVASDNIGTVGYNVYRDGDYFDTVFTTTFTDANPSASRVNIYTVVAFDEARNYSPESAGLSVRVGDTPDPDDSEFVPAPDPIPVPSPVPTQTPGSDGQPDTTSPSVPTGLALAISGTANIFTWQASNDNVGVVGYNVDRDGEYLLTTRSTSFVDVNVDPNSNHTYSVVAFDEARNFSSRSGVVSQSRSGSAPEPQTPTEPETPNEPIVPTVPEVPAEPESPVGPVVTLPTADDSGEIVPPVDPSNRFPSPNANDPFGSLLEVDNEVPIPGGPPTTPKNLRFDLVANNWAEFSWAPANDDEAVVSYNIYRSDGVVYPISPDLTDPNGGAQAEIDKYWSTTSFIDCNFTRFDTRLYNCRDNQPVPGETYTYQVSAFDAQGQESPRSAPLAITYHLRENAPVPIFDDFFKMPDDRFAQNNSFAETRFFLDEFDLIFNDEFEGTSIDPTKWQTELTFGDSFIINGEQQYFVNTQRDPEFGFDPFTFDGDILTINAIPTPPALEANLPPVCDAIDPTGNERCLFLSGALSTQDRFGFLYGYVEGRMKPSASFGALSSFFLFHRFPGSGVNLHAPEIDILEYLGENPFGDEDAFQTYHFDDVNTGQTRSAPTMSFENPTGELYSDEFHTFGVLWEPQLMIWYIDGVEIQRITGPMVSRQPMNVVTYLVAGSAWAPTPDVTNPDNFPLQFDIDYLRVFQREAYQGTASFGR